MRNPGLEPGSLAALEPESSASANSASSAGIEFSIDNFLLLLICSCLSIAVSQILQLRRRWGLGLTDLGKNLPNAQSPMPNLVPQELCPSFTEYPDLPPALA